MAGNQDIRTEEEIRYDQRVKAIKQSVKMAELMGIDLCRDDLAPGMVVSLSIEYRPVSPIGIQSGSIRDWANYIYISRREGGCYKNYLQEFLPSSLQCARGSLYQLADIEKEFDPDDRFIPLYMFHKISDTDLLLFTSRLGSNVEELRYYAYDPENNRPARQIIGYGKSARPGPLYVYRREANSLRKIRSLSEVPKKSFLIPIIEL
jgi:hypothetical protein